MAEFLDCEVEWVLDNKEALGGVPMREGAKPRYRFELAYVDQVMRARRNGSSASPQPPAVRKPRRRTAKAQASHSPSKLRVRPSVLPIG